VIQELVSSILMIVGAVFILLASIGLLRLPDLFTRMQAATKAAVLGAACMLLAMAFHFSHDLGTVARSVATLAFIFLTAPVAAHMIARAAYFLGVPMWQGSVLDDLKDQYDQTTHELSSDFRRER
jgi:multicomponent Na+:H+ antiporter subunit G